MGSFLRVRVLDVGTDIVHQIDTRLVGVSDQLRHIIVESFYFELESEAWLNLDFEFCPELRNSHGFIQDVTIIHHHNLLENVDISRGFKAHIRVRDLVLDGLKLVIRLEWKHLILGSNELESEYRLVQVALNFLARLVGAEADKCPVLLLDARNHG